MAINLSLINSFPSTSPDALDFDPVSGNIFSVESFRSNPDSVEGPDDFSLTLVEYDIAIGTVAAYYPEANVLISASYYDEQAMIPAYKSVPVRVAPALI